MTGGAKPGLALTARGRPALSSAQKIAWLRLIRTDGIGPVTFRELINRFGGAERALEMLPTLTRHRKGIAAPISAADAAAELERADDLGMTPAFLGDENYPVNLAALDVPPPMLYLKGRPELAQRATIAIVGSRSGSAAGRRMARDLASGLGAAGFTIASGLARGIDGAAHEASLATGSIAVVAGGADHIYPPEHAELQARLGVEGLIITERAPGAIPRDRDFPRRNRIISGVSAGLIVVEAAARSGSLISARMAAEQGREVFAVPGHPLDPRAKGTLGLLRQGATLCSSVEDVIEIMTPICAVDPVVHDAGGFSDPECGRQASDGWNATDDSGAADDSLTANDNTAEEISMRVRRSLSITPIEIDVIARETGLSIRDVRGALLVLDLAGDLERHGLQAVSLRPDETA